MINWVAQTDRDTGQRHDGPTSAEMAVLRRLRKENKRLREEREMLAKGEANSPNAWFARETEPTVNSDTSSSR